MRLTGVITGSGSHRRLGLAVKRGADLVGSLVALLVLSPLMAGIAVVVWIDSGRPILYRSRRHGREGRPFTMYNFRTMVPDADARLSDVLHLNRAEGNQVKIPNDPRQTRVGALLRRASLDHLPNLFNVIKGEMSLIGPRPHTLQEYPVVTAELLERLQMRPGITGLWQVSARNHSSEAVRVAYDLEYIRGWSLTLDGLIALRTLPAVLRCRGGEPIAQAESAFPGTLAASGEGD